METAIKKAIEGGYDEHKFDGAHISREEGIAIVTSDPSFWQCLGKTMGWKKNNLEVKVPYSAYKLHPNGCVTSEIEKADIPEWLYRWHTFIDHLAEGKSADDFFRNLIGEEE